MENTIYEYFLRRVRRIWGRQLSHVVARESASDFDRAKQDQVEEMRRRVANAINQANNGTTKQTSLLTLLNNNPRYREQAERCSTEIQLANSKSEILSIIKDFTECINQANLPKLE